MRSGRGAEGPCRIRQPQALPIQELSNHFVFRFQALCVCMESLNWVQGASSMSVKRLLDQSKVSDMGPIIYLVGRLMNVGSVFGVRIRP